MRVKIGNKIYDSNDQPIMLILSPEEKALIRDMHPQATKFCSAPDGLPAEVISMFMRELSCKQILKSELQVASLVYGKPFRQCRRADRKKMLRYVINTSDALRRYQQDIINKRIYADRENPE